MLQISKGTKEDKNGFEVFFYLKNVNPENKAAQDVYVNATISVGLPESHYNSYIGSVYSRGELKASHGFRWTHFASLDEIKQRLVGDTLTISVRVGRDLCAKSNRPVDPIKTKILNLEKYTDSKMFHDVLIHINNDRNNRKKGDNPPKINYCGEEDDHDFLYYNASGNRTFYSHKVILCGASGWFKKMLEPKNGATQKVELTLNNVDPEVFETLLCCVYSSELLVDDFVGAIDLLIPAKEFGFKTLCSQIMRFFRQDINHQNIWLVWSMANRTACTQTETACRKYLEENPVLSMKNACWLAVKSSLAINFMSMETFTKPVDESIFFEAAVAWRTQNMEWTLNGGGPIHEENAVAIERGFSEMIRCVRFPQMDPHYLTNVVEKEAVFKNMKGSKDLILEAYRFHAGASEPSSFRCYPRYSPSESIASKALVKKTS
ncbi:hypothetical protein F4703DRAFT_1954653 [Phycomyces blakesleeanus]